MVRALRTLVRNHRYRQRVGVRDTERADREACEAAEDGAADTDAAGDGEALTPEAQLEAVTKAFESGDIDAMAKALKKPGVKLAGPVRRAFRAFQHRERKAVDVILSKAVFEDVPMENSSTLNVEAVELEICHNPDEPVGPKA